MNEDLRINYQYDEEPSAKGHYALMLLSEIERDPNINLELLAIRLIENSALTKDEIDDILYDWRQFRMANMSSEELRLLTDEERIGKQKDEVYAQQKKSKYLIYYGILNDPDFNYYNVVLELVKNGKLGVGSASQILGFWSKEQKAKRSLSKSSHSSLKSLQEIRTESQARSEIPHLATGQMDKNKIFIARKLKEILDLDMRENKWFDIEPILVKAVLYDYLKIEEARDILNAWKSSLAERLVFVFRNPHNYSPMVRSNDERYGHFEDKYRIFFNTKIPDSRLGQFLHHQYQTIVLKLKFSRRE